MNKTISITLNGLNFYVEEQAYAKLDSWLEAIKAHFTGDEDATEIIADIEIRLAEQMAAKITKSKEVITYADIEKIIAEMGTVHDFEAMDGEEKEPMQKNEPTAEGPRRLYRNSDDMIIAGVASGIAAYFGIDPVWIRLLFVASIFAGGTGIFLYLVLWIIVPEAKSASQKLEMQGTPVTLKQLEKSIKDNLPVRSKNALATLLTLPFQIVGYVFTGIKKLFRKLLPILRVLIGLIATIGGLIGLLASSFVMFVLLFNTDTTHYDRALVAFSHDVVFPFLVSFGYLVVAIPLFVLILSGVSFVRKKNVFSVATGTLLVGVWMVAAVITGALVFDSIPKIERLVSDEADRGEITTRTFDQKDFDYIVVSRDAHDVTVQYGEEFAIEATGNELDVNDIEIEKNASRLYIERTDRYFCFFGCQIRPLEITVTMPRLRGVRLGGASTASISGFTKETTDTVVEFYLTGASKADVSIDATKVDATVYSASLLTLTGSANIFDLTASSAARVDADEFIASDIKADLSSASNASLNAVETLDVNVRNASTVTYLGNPVVTDAVSTSGTLKALNSPNATTTPEIE